MYAGGRPAIAQAPTLSPLFGVRGGAPPSVRSLGWVEDSIVGSCPRKILVTARGFCHFEKVKLPPSHSRATKGAVPAVEAFTFCVGLAWLARCVLPMNTGDRAPGGGANPSSLKAGVVVAKVSSQPCQAFTVVSHTTN